MSDLGLFSPLPAKGSTVSAGDETFVGQNSEEPAPSCSTNQDHFMCPLVGDSMAPEADSPGAGSGPGGASASGSGLVAVDGS